VRGIEIVTVHGAQILSSHVRWRRGSYFQRSDAVVSVMAACRTLRAARI
jgi:hypothetical protein